MTNPSKRGTASGSNRTPSFDLHVGRAKPDLADATHGLKVPQPRRWLCGPAPHPLPQSARCRTARPSPGLGQLPSVELTAPTSARLQTVHRRATDGMCGRILPRGHTREHASRLQPEALRRCRIWHRRARGSSRVSVHDASPSAWLAPNVSRALTRSVWKPGRTAAGPRDCLCAHPTLPRARLVYLNEFTPVKGAENLRSIIDRPGHTQDVSCINVERRQIVCWAYRSGDACSQRCRCTNR